MYPTEFVLEMAGISKLIPEGGAPTPEQWQAIHSMIKDANAYVVGQKIIEMTEEHQRKSKLEREIREYMRDQNMAKTTFPPYAPYAPNSTVGYPALGQTGIVYGSGQSAVKITI